MLAALRGYLYILARPASSWADSALPKKMENTMRNIAIAGQRIRLALNEDLGLTVRAADGELLWESAPAFPPWLWVAVGPRFHEGPLAAAGSASVAPFADGRYRGHRLHLSGYEGTDAVVELAIGIDVESDEVLLQVQQIGGADAVYAVRNFYRFEKPTAAGGHLVLPHGSGYLIPADCPDTVPGRGEVGGFIGARWTLPLFGLVRADTTLCAIAENWWDCEVHAEHVPGEHSAIGFNWEASLGRLAYARRLLLRFDAGLDYAGMAKLYRQHARRQELVRALEEKAEQTPLIRRYIGNVLYRWPAWNPNEGPAVLEDIRRLRDAGLGVNCFYPKWSPAGYSPQEGTPTTASAGWQAFLHSTPVPGGWPTLVQFEKQLHELGCVVQGFICPISQVPEGVQFDTGRGPLNALGQRQHHPLSSYDALARMKQVFNALEQAGLELDVLYYDGFSAHVDLPQDFALTHPMSRRQNIEAELACFGETRQRGLIPGAELTRFWAIDACDYFFFTDWSSDRLANTPNQGAPAPVGVPVPLFQLVFHDCFIAGFSGGGYAAYSEGYDWWEQHAPRLYELMYGAAPSYNWLPDPLVPMTNWDAGQQRDKRAWLKLWSQFYRSIALSEMTAHQFLAPDRTHQRVEFENGVAAEFDLSANRFRIAGAAGLEESWQTPPEL